MENFSVEEPTFLKKPNRKKPELQDQRLIKMLLINNGYQVIHSVTF